MIALDAMGGDYGPSVTVHGAIHAAKKGIPVGLFGDESQLYPLLNAADSQWRSYPISIFHCSETIAMGDEPTRSILKKTDASLVRALHAVAQGQATAVVSAGNSGAALVGGILGLGRVPGVHRPALGNSIPTTTGSLFCIDLGANADCKPEFLSQFALMGYVYVKMQGVDNPRIALLSNGAEPYKGSQLIQETFDLLSRMPINFVGNLESRDIFDGHADVLVCDGFTGNIMLKAVQGAAKTVSSWIGHEIGRLPWYRKIGAALLKPAFSQVKHKINYADKGGALLLGLNHPLIVAHGCASAAAIERAIVFAHEVTYNGFLARFNAELGELISLASTTSAESNIQSETNL
ncbi:MAG: phosphate acyltransferase PlsX [Candidatus Babeliales bacterium]